MVRRPEKPAACSSLCIGASYYLSGSGTVPPHAGRMFIHTNCKPVPPGNAVVVSAPMRGRRKLVPALSNMPRTDTYKVGRPRLTLLKHLHMRTCGHVACGNIASRSDLWHSTAATERRGR